MNASMERPITVWDEMFLPGELERVIDQLGLAAKTIDLHQASRPATPDEAPTHGPWLLLVGLLWGGLAWILGVRWRRTNRRRWRVALGSLHMLTGLLFGVLGTLGALMWALTEWAVTFDNANQLLANPITLMALPLGVAVIFGSDRARGLLYRCWLVLCVTSALALLLAAFSITAQANGAVIALLLPLNVGFAQSLRPALGQ